MKGELIEVYKIMIRAWIKRAQLFPSIENSKNQREWVCRGNFFTPRIVHLWNELPEEAIDAERFLTLKIYFIRYVIKNGLESYGQMQALVQYANLVGMDRKAYFYAVGIWLRDLSGLGSKQMGNKAKQRSSQLVMVIVIPASPHRVYNETLQLCGINIYICVYLEVAWSGFTCSLMSIVRQAKQDLDTISGR